MTGRGMQVIKKILCATDLSEASDRLISIGVEISRRFDAVFLVFHSIPPPHGSITRQIEFSRGGEKDEKIQDARKKIETLMKRFEIKWEAIITYGDPVLEVAKIAQQTKSDMVIAASMGLSGFHRFLMGSVIGSMSQSLPQPFLVIPPVKTAPDAAGPAMEFNHIIIACRLAQSDRDLKNTALAFSEKFKARISLVHVLESPVKAKLMTTASGNYNDAQRLFEEKTMIRLKNFMPADAYILHGVPGEELAMFAKQQGADLIIAGIDDRPGRIITTTTAALIRQLPCAVLTVPIPL